MVLPALVTARARLGRGAWRRRPWSRWLPLALLALAAACGDPAPRDARSTATIEGPAHFSGELALAHVRAQMQWVPRDTGSEGWRKTGDYISEELQRFGWQVEEQPFEVMDQQAKNIIARRGAGPVILLGAHYDTRRRADADPATDRRDEPVPGAVDGGSGVAVLLELARVLRQYDLSEHEIRLAFFDAEDNGELDGWPWIAGSTYMAEQLSFEPQAMVLVDMIGQRNQQIYYEVSSTDWLQREIWAVAKRLGYDSFVPRERWHLTDDHTPFLEQGISAVDIIDFDYPQWHTTADTIEHMSAGSLEEVGRTLEEWLLSQDSSQPGER